MSTNNKGPGPLHPGAHSWRDPEGRTQGSPGTRSGAFLAGCPSSRGAESSSPTTANDETRRTSTFGGKGGENHPTGLVKRILASTGRRDTVRTKSQSAPVCGNTPGPGRPGGRAAAAGACVGVKAGARLQGGLGSSEPNRCARLSPPGPDPPANCCGINDQRQHPHAGSAGSNANTSGLTRGSTWPRPREHAPVSPLGHPGGSAPRPASRGAGSAGPEQPPP